MTHDICQLSFGHNLVLLSTGLSTYHRFKFNVSWMAILLVFVLVTQERPTKCPDSHSAVVRQESARLRLKSPRRPPLCCHDSGRLKLVTQRSHLTQQCHHGGRGAGGWAKLEAAEASGRSSHSWKRHFPAATRAWKDAGLCKNGHSSSFPVNETRASSIVAQR